MTLKHQTIDISLPVVEQILMDILTTCVEGGSAYLQGACKVNSTIREDTLTLAADPDRSNWDAETADCVLQAGMFGEIVYG